MKKILLSAVLLLLLSLSTLMTTRPFFTVSQTQVVNATISLEIPKLEEVQIKPHLVPSKWYAHEAHLVDPVFKWTMYDISRRNKLYQGGSVLPSEYIALPAKHLPLDLAAKNRTLPTNVVFYNRVPKTGSTTFHRLISLNSGRNLHRKNMFSSFFAPVSLSKTEFQDQCQSKDQELHRVLIEMPKNFSAVLYNRHFYFANFETLSGCEMMPKMNWINMIRDPIDRFVSRFHYVRSLKRWGNVQPRPSVKFFQKRLDECVLNSDEECNFNPDGTVLKEQQLTYFCGHALECRVVGHAGALQQAKANVDRHFAVVGILDDLEGTLAVLEKWLPLVFSGILATYKNHFQLHENETRHLGLSAKARQILKNNLTTEYDFFHFVRSRLERQKKLLQPAT